MAFFEVRSMDGSNLMMIDGNYRGLFLRQKGVMQTDTVVSSQYGVSSGTFFINNCVVMPIVAVYSPNGLGCVGALAQLDTTTWRANFTLQAATGTLFEWFAFDALRDSDASPYGLWIRNLQNQLIFDALRKPQRVVDSFTVPGEQAGGGRYEVGRKYAVACSGGIWVSSFSGGSGQSGYVVRLVGAKVTNEQVTVAPFQIIGQNGSSFEQRRPSNVLVCDVTGY
ncbi:hypothetical protein K6X13_14655 [Xanthomonas euvesicatoria pv. allii]|uniref:hypothetical protein n=1 Tax=Xanthomonas euvesicatoria TaxID=456327 RepID=UPI002404FF34|nr:hypothetical protein [Xanthomonas euvesicatoria]MCP3048320.1 hypothetical protein [Xanthomonas euvesicatoria pv. allii]